MLKTDCETKCHNFKAFHIKHEGTAFSALIYLLLPEDFQAEPAPSWIGSPASYFVHRSHSTVDLKKEKKDNDNNQCAVAI